MWRLGSKGACHTPSCYIGEGPGPERWEFAQGCESLRGGWAEGEGVIRGRFQEVVQPQGSLLQVTLD